MLRASIRTIPLFPKKLADELVHCILAHHGELEFGSPKKPAIAEAFALNMADNTECESFRYLRKYLSRQEIRWSGSDLTECLDSNIRQTYGTRFNK